MQPDLQHIRRRLSRRYGLFISCLLGVFALGVYTQVARLREAQSRKELEHLASTAAAELQLLHHEHDEMLRPDLPLWLRDHARGALRGDPENGDPNIRILWFDDQLHELKTRGSYQPAASMIPPAGRIGSVQWLPLSDGLALWQPVVHPSKVVEGYVSVAVATASADQELARLRQGILIGALVSGMVGIVGSHWMVSASLEPIRRQIARLIRFTGDASHELRHPLTAIRALIGTLQHGDLLTDCPPPVVQKLQLIDRSTERMGRLVDDLLLLSRSDRAIDDSGGMRDFPLEELVEDVIALHLAEAEAAGLGLESVIEASPLVHGDPERLRRLLENLLSNALRFSPPCGRVTVGLAQKQERALLWVDDQGPGDRKSTRLNSSHSSVSRMPSSA